MESGTMNERQNSINRRAFLKSLTAAGLGSVLASADVLAAEKLAIPKIAKRKFGQLTLTDKSGKKVPVELPELSLGTYRVDTENQLLLRKALQYGINYWDTAWNYQNGQAELGIGKFIKRSPELRKDLFIASKASKPR